MTDNVFQIVAPIFIVGFPRSGTTFLQSLLATQDGVVTFPETHFYSVLTGHLDTSKGIPRASMTDVIERATNYLELNPDEVIELKKFGSKDDFVNRRLFFEKLLELLCERQGLTISRNDILLEKTPSHAFHLRKIAKDFPDLRIVHLTRHPVDSISSYQKHLSQGNKSITELVKEWIRSHDSVQEFSEDHSDKVYRLRYEDLGADTEGEMVKLMSWLGIEPDLDKMAGYASKASDYIMSFEPWKNNNTETEFQPSVNGLSSIKKAQVQFHLDSRMRSQGYRSKSPVVQFLYNLKNGGAR